MRGYVRGAADKSDKTILVVDYDPVFRESLVDILNRAGYKASGAPNGASAIKAAGSLATNRKEIDLLIVEMAQLDMSSGALINAIAVEQKTAIKVIATSSLFTQADLDTQTAFRSDAAIRKEAASANASKWLLVARSLLGELADPAPAPSNCVILLADDDPSVRHLVRMLLSREGYQVLETADGESALALARKVAAVDLVVTDIEMPKMDGRALGKAIRADSAKVPIIYMSGMEDPDLIHLNRTDDGVAFVAKPFVPKTLLDAVSAFLIDRCHVT
jgi:CheY-like chemotaxis protein